MRSMSGAVPGVGPSGGGGEEEGVAQVRSRETVNELRGWPPAAAGQRKVVVENSGKPSGRAERPHAAMARRNRARKRACDAQRVQRTAALFCAACRTPVRPPLAPPAAAPHRAQPGHRPGDARRRFRAAGGRRRGASNPLLHAPHAAANCPRRPLHAAACGRMRSHAPHAPRAAPCGSALPCACARCSRSAPARPLPPSRRRCRRRLRRPPRSLALG